MARTKGKYSVKMSLLAGDTAILILMAWVLLASGKPLTNLEILIGAITLAVGAWLAWLALSLD